MYVYRIVNNLRPLSDWLVSLTEAQRILADIHPALRAYIVKQWRD